MGAERVSTACDPEDWRDYGDDQFDETNWQGPVEWIPCQSCEGGFQTMHAGDDTDDDCWCCHGEYLACERCTEELT